MSYNFSQVAVSVVIQYLSNLVDEPVKSSLNNVLDIIDTFPPTSSTLPVECLENTKDGLCMLKSLEYLRAVKEDSQQRSWQIYDDYVHIENCLVELISILVGNHSLIILSFILYNALSSKTNLNNFIIYFIT